MTIKELRDRNLILLECISGSRAYGLDTKDSDTDIKGVFYLPKDDFYGFGGPTQVANETNDIVFYEMGKFFELLAKNNPNILDLLNTPEDSVLYKNPILDKVQPQLFLSKLCAETYGQYALTQIKKAKGLNKKILNPVEPERKRVLDFCFVVHGQGSIPLKEFLEEQQIDQNQCGLSKIPHMHESYGLYIKEGENFKGIILKENANDVALSSIPKRLEPTAIMTFNKSSYSSYCKSYKEYWQWVEKRNNVRYQNTLSHGKNYDAKNMMHTMRLLRMAEEIGKEGKINVRRNDREYLLKVKSGEFEYDDLVRSAEEKIEAIKQVYKNCQLPDRPDVGQIKSLLVEIRNELYN